MDFEVQSHIVSRMVLDPEIQEWVVEQLIMELEVHFISKNIALLARDFPTGRRTPKQQFKKPTGRFAPERRLIMKMPSQQEDLHPNSKSKTQQKDLPQEEDLL